MKPKVHEVLEKPGIWIQGYMFKNSENNPCDINQFCSACLMGWLIFIYRDDEKFDEVHDKLTNKIGSIPLWNDEPGRTQEEVKQICKELDI